MCDKIVYKPLLRPSPVFLRLLSAFPYTNKNSNLSDLPSEGQTVEPCAEEVCLAPPALPLCRPGYAAHHAHVALSGVPRQSRHLGEQVIKKRNIPLNTQSLQIFLNIHFVINDPTRESYKKYS